MAVSWTEDLATGIEVIDDQHKEIFKRIDGLLEACKAGKGREAVAGVLVFLENYVVEHFAAEEKIQRDNLYPEYANHRAMHAAFIDDVAALKQQFEDEGPSLAMVMVTNRKVVDWLVHHIKKHDRALGGYLKTKGFKGSV
jgi:hemerythrin